jgi:hypothetical protein
MDERLRWFLDPSLVPFIVIASTWAIWAFGAAVEYDTHVKFEGKLKRGIRIWSEPLPGDMERFLGNLPRSILSTKTGRFIKRQDDAILIQGVRLGRWRRGTPCIAYVDLQKEEPKIEYRNPISTTLFFVALIGMAIWASFLHVTSLIAVLISLLMLAVPFLVQKRQILNFIDRTMRSCSSHQTRVE